MYLKTRGQGEKTRNTGISIYIRTPNYAKTVYYCIPTLNPPPQKKNLSEGGGVIFDSFYKSDFWLRPWIKSFSLSNAEMISKAVKEHVNKSIYAADIF